MSDEMMMCPMCDKLIAINSVSCQYCLTGFDKCPNCKKLIPSGCGFCHHCGFVSEEKQALKNHMSINISLFENIDVRIKQLASPIAWIGITGSIVNGIFYINSGIEADSTIIILSGVRFMILGSLLSLISSFVLYGFGKLIEYAKIIAENTKPK